jgi:hypothetical protein
MQESWRKGFWLGRLTRDLRGMKGRSKGLDL